MRREININGRTVQYELTGKRVKNINIRIAKDGSVRVSAPNSVSLRAVEDCLRRKGAWICSVLDRIGATQRRKERIDNGETVCVFGVKYRLAFKASPRYRSEINDAVLCLSVKDPSDEGLRLRAYYRWRDHFCRETVKFLCQNCYPAFRAKGVEYPEIAFRRMKSRWGSCLFGKKKLIFNLNLAEVPVGGAEYVVYHEFAHLLEPNHSTRFYAILDDVLPDWRERKRHLEGRE